MKYIWQHKKWPAFIWQEKKLLHGLGSARLCQGKLLSRAATLGMDLNREARSAILVEEAVQTAAIEGQILDRASVRSSVAKRLGLPTAGMPPPDRNTEGLVDVLLDATVNYQKPLTAKRLKSWQAALFPTGYSGLNRIRTGQWRGKSPMRVVSGPVGKEKVHFLAPPQERISHEIKQFLTWWKSGADNLEGLLRAGIAHFWFITIHPFEDGNGRIARALTDMALARDEGLPVRFYSLSARIMKERDDYYTVLEMSQKSGLDITEWLLWFLGCFERSISHSRGIISKVLAKAEFWQQHSQTSINTHQLKVINRLLDAGPGKFEGGLTTRKYVSIAKVSRATAYREITDLLNKNMLRQNPGKGRNVSYDIAWVDKVD